MGGPDGIRATSPAASPPRVTRYEVGPVPPGFAPSQGDTWSLASHFQPLDDDRYVAVGFALRSLSPGPDGKTRLAFPILDLNAGSVSMPEVPSSPALRGTPELVHYDAEHGHAGLFGGRGDGATAYTFAHWDLGASQVDWSVPLGDIDDHTSVQPIGVDPKGQYFYFLKETNSREKLDQFTHGETATVGRVNLATRAVDWTHDITLPHRTNTLMGGLTVHASPDYSRIAVFEYSDPAHLGAAVPPEGYIVDTTSGTHRTLAIPQTPYGVAFDRRGRHIAIASNADAKVYRFDLITGRQDASVSTIGRAHAIALSGDEARLYVFAKGRAAQLRDWPTLQSAQSIAPGSLVPGQAFFDPEGMAVMPDGRHAIMATTESRFGFRDDQGFYSVRLDPPTGSARPARGR